MAKINPNLLPAPSAPRIEKVTAEVPGQEDFVLYLRQPGFSELLKQQEQVQAAIEEWEKTGNWYPSVPPIQPSGALWQVVIPTLALQCSETGEELADDDRYTEQELVPIVGRVRPVYTALASAIALLTNLAGNDLGNE